MSGDDCRSRINAFLGKKARGRGIKNNYCLDSVQTHISSFIVITGHELYGEGGLGDKA